MHISTLFSLLLASSTLRVCLSWSQEELDLFDLVEEIPENFYSILQVDQSASASEIRRSYRQLSLQLHPDKSDDPEAAEKFRKLVAVAEILRDEDKRAHYDVILRDGLPDWKQPLYYYRRVRKMGLFELCIFLLIILTVAQYMFGWAVYAEKLLVLQEVISRKQKKDERKSSRKTKSSSHSLEAELEYYTSQADASIPRLKNLLPVLLAKKLLSLIKTFWRLYCQWKDSSTPVQYDHNQLNGVTNNDDEVCSSSKSKGREKKKISKQTVRESSSDTDNSSHKQKVEEHGSNDHSKRSEYNEQPPVSETATSNCRVSNRNETTESEMVEQSIKTSTKRSYPTGLETNSSDLQDNSFHGDVSSWSQYQQIQLEWALTAYPKFTIDRWENIAKAVPGKTKDECIQRCRELFEAVKKRKLIVNKPE